MAFTTWADALSALKDRIADGDVTVGTITVNGKTITWQSLNQFWIHYNNIEQRAGLEAGTFKPRSYAKDGGRG
jgi:hypothetical protein